jgi:predicted nucleic acid-binding protein
VGPSATGTLTFDSGALIAIEEGNERIRALLNVATQRGLTINVPAPVIAEVWRGGTGRQARLAAFLKRGRRTGHLQVIDLDYPSALQVGVLLSTIEADVVSITDATVAWCVKKYGGAVYTSDPSDLLRFLPPRQVRQI